MRGTMKLFATLTAATLVAAQAFAAVTVTVNGTNYTIPQTNEKGWGTNVTNWIQAITSNTLQPIGGTFSLTNDVNFGASHGLVAPYYLSRSSNTATGGVVRLANADSIAWRNAANSADLPLGVNTSNQLTFNGNPITSSTALTANRAVVTGTGGILAASATTDTEISYVSGVTSAIQTQLNGKQATGSYLTALTGDVAATGPGSATATIQAGAVTDSKIAAGAAIARSKIAVGNAYRVVTNDVGGALIDAAAITASRALQSDANGIPTASATTATELGYVSGVTSAIQTQINNQIPKSTVTTKGDLITTTGSATVTRRAVGSDGQVLTADSTQTDGVKWATPASAPSASYEASNCSIASSVASNILTIALKDASGSDPSAGSTCKIGFRSSTASSGVYNQRSVSAALSMTVGNGSTLGTSNATDAYLFVYALDNAGTVELAVSSKLFDDGSTQSTTAEGGGTATSATTMYSTTARTAVPIRLLARLKVNEATAGTWAAVPTELSLNPNRTVYRTVQRLTSGSGTYTTPVGAKLLRVRAVGGGGGGGAGGSVGAGTPLAGGTTTFGSSLLTANPGQPGVNNGGVGGVGGSTTVNAPAIAVTSLSGGSGGGSGYTGTALIVQGGMGAASPFGGAGGGAFTNGAAGNAAIANSGSGGGGGATSGAAANAGGSGGGAGGYIEALIPSPAASYSYAVGAAGTGASPGGTNGSAGGAGGSGVIIVEEYY